MPTPNALARLLGAMAPSGDPVELLDKVDPRAVARRSTNEGTLEVAAARQDHSKLVKETLEAAALGKALDDRQEFALEAIILPGLRPAIDVIGDGFETVDNPLWLDLNTNETWRANLARAIRSVGRIELPFQKRDDVYGGTGFVVGPGLVMTNRHVAEIFAKGLGLRDIGFRPGRDAGVNLRRERDTPGATLKVKRVVMIHPYWDCALLEVEGLPAEAKPLLLTDGAGESFAKAKVAIIGYPAFDPRNPANVQNDVFDGEYQIKRLQPGLVNGVGDTPSFGKVVSAITHDCSTLGGNSGSCVVDLETGVVLGLHFGGAFKVSNFAVPAGALAADSRVWDAGVNFKGSRPGKDAPWASWWTSADEFAAAPAAIGDAGTVATQSPPPPPPPPRGPGADLAADGAGGKGPTVSVSGDGAVRLTIPLEVTVRLGGVLAAQVSTADAPDGATPAARGSEATTEKMVMPVHDTDYASRKGYDPTFLAAGAAPGEAARLAAPAPKPKDPSVVAPLLEGGDVLHYQNFSIVMHARRRLALFTAANLSAEKPLRRPEKGKDYTRKGLTGLGDNDREQWFPDRRLDAAHQLPDHFYTYDDGQFDKGHLVRREDAAWGTTYALLRRANGDTYHVTNCSPQVADFNRSGDGEDNWGDLENVVFKQAATERLSLFSGPILAEDDPVFLGRLPGGQRTRVKIPKRYWKIVVARGAEGLASFGFMLEQNLDDMPTVEGLEFAPLAFARYMRPIAAIGREAGVVFDKTIVAADQFEVAGGEEVAYLAGATRRR